MVVRASLSAAVVSAAFLCAEDQVAVTFAGPDSIHIAYHADVHSDPVWLADEESGFELLQQVPPGNGTYRYESPADGIYRFTLGMYSNGSVWVTLANLPHYIDYNSDEIYGYLLFDETVDRTDALELNAPVIVPTGISLTLTRCLLDSAYWVARDFLVSGTLALTENVTYITPSYMQYEVHGPQSLVGLRQGNWFFKDGSGGTTLNDAQNANVYSYETLSISDAQALNLYCGDGADVFADSSIFNQIAITGVGAAVELISCQVLGGCYMRTNTSLTADNSLFSFNSPALALYDNAEFTATDGSVHSLSANAPAGTCTLTGTTNGPIALTALAKGRFTDCRVNGTVSVSAAASSDVVFDTCRFWTGVNVTKAPVQFKKCDFGGIAAVSTPCAAKFEQCQFLRSLEIHLVSAGDDKPVVENNAFLYKDAIKIGGDQALTNEPIVIGANYYGDPTGPNYGAKYTGDELFSSRGGTVSWWPGLQLAPALKKGLSRSLDDMPLHVWSFARRYGQGSIPHGYVLWSEDQVCQQGRETAFIVDVGVNREEYQGIEFRAVYNGAYVAPTRGATPTLRRDYSSLSSVQQEAGLNTLNFILPPTDKSANNLAIEYRLSSSSPFTFLDGVTVYCTPSPARKLKLFIVPVRLHVWGYPGGAPNASGFAPEFTQALSAKFAIPRDMIEIRHRHRPFDYYGALGTLSLTYLLNDLAAQVGVNTAVRDACSYIRGASPTTDYTVILLDKGALKANGVDGASLPWIRSYVFTDGDTDALLHEFGHAFGLWRSPEQYDAHPKFGLRTVGVTAFVTEPGGVPGFMGDQRRIRHFPSSNLYWYTEKNCFDIMGGAPKGGAADFWPVMSTAKRFRDSLSTLLVTNTSAAAAAPPLGDARRIYVRGKLAYKHHGDYQYTYIVPWSLDIMDITALSDHAVAGPQGHSVSDYQYRFEGFDSTGGCVFSETFYCGGDYYGTVKGDWYRTFDVPESAVAYRVKGLYNPWTREEPGVIWESEAAGAISTQILSPAPGTEITGDTFLRWQNQTSRRALSEPSVPPLRHMVWSSTDGGATWEAQSDLLAVEEIDLSFGELPGGTGLMYRVFSSDGFSTHSATIAGLSVAPRPPEVTIIAPKAHDRGTTGTWWSLIAELFDRDSDGVTNVTWTSSLDGPIGAGLALTGCHLSVGTHVLSCTATKSPGLDASASTTVHVTEGLDYYLPPGSLWLCSTESGPYAPQCAWLLTGTPVKVCFAMRAPGGASAVSARIRMTPPGGPVQLLATTTWTQIEDFAPLYLETSVVPHAWGTYIFRAELTDMTPADSVPGGTSLALSCATREPPRLASKWWVQTLDFGYQDEDSIPTGAFVEVYNAGGAPLQMGQLSLGGPHASAYSLEQDALSGASLQPGQTGTVRVVFDPTAAGCNQAYLALPCNDPYRSAYAFSISGDYLIPEPGFVLWLLPAWYAVRNRRR